MDTERYRSEVDDRLNLDDRKKQAWIEELSSRSSSADAADPHDRPYLSYAPAPPPPPRRPVWLRWAAAAAAVLLLAGAAFAFWPRRGLETVGEGDVSGGSASPTDTTAPFVPPAVSGETTADEETGTTSAAAGNGTNPAVAFDPDDPLSVFQDFDYIGLGFSKEQAMAVFKAVDTVQELMNLPGTEGQYWRDPGRQAIGFYGMSALQQGISYNLTENYQTNMLELSYNAQDGEWITLASKLLPSGSNFVDAYHQYMLKLFSYNVISYDTLNQILDAGHVAPFVDNPDVLTSDGTWVDASVKQLGFSFYLAEEKREAWISEDYIARELRVYLCRADESFVFGGSNSNGLEPYETRPLPPDADVTDYATLREGWPVDPSPAASESSEPVQAGEATTSTVTTHQCGWVIMPTEPAVQEPKERLTLDKVIELAEKRGNALTWSDFEPYEREEIGSGLVITLFPIDKNYRLQITRAAPADQVPVVIDLVYSKTGEVETGNIDDRIDIRTGDVRAFLNR